MAVYSAFGAQQDVSLGGEADGWAAGFGHLFAQQQVVRARRGERDRLDAGCVDDVDAEAALGHQPLDEIVVALAGCGELLARRLLHAVPQAAQDDGALGVAVGKADQHLVADFRHGGEAEAGTAMQAAHRRPQHCAALLPEEGNSQPAALVRIVVGDHAPDLDAVRSCRLGPLLAVPLLPGCGHEVVPVLFGRPAVNDLGQVPGAVCLGKVADRDCAAGGKRRLPRGAATEHGRSLGALGVGLRAGLHGCACG